MSGYSHTQFIDHNSEVENKKRNMDTPLYVTDLSAIHHRSHNSPGPKIIRRSLSEHDLGFAQGRITTHIPLEEEFSIQLCLEKYRPSGMKKFFIYMILFIFISVNVLYDAQNLIPGQSPSSVSLTHGSKNEDSWMKSSKTTLDEEGGTSNVLNSRKSSKDINEFSSSLQIMHGTDLKVDPVTPSSSKVEVGSSAASKNIRLNVVGVEKVVAEKGIGRDLTTTNFLPSAFLDLKSLEEFEEISTTLPYYWEILPRMKGKYRLTWFLDECFDLNRAVAVGQNGRSTHPLVVKSKERPAEVEDVISGRDILHTLNVFEAEDKKGPMFSLLIHPIQRAALLFEHLRSSKDDPLYHEKFEEMDLLSYAEFLTSDSNDTIIATHRKNIGDWYTRSLSFSDSATVLTNKHLEEAKTMLREKCLVGRFDFLPASLERFKKLLHINNNMSHEKERGINSCLEPFISSRMVQTPVVPGSDEWKLLASINQYDVQLYNRALEVFEEQGNLSFLQKKSNSFTSGLQRISQIKNPIKIISPLQFPFFWDTIPPNMGRRPVVSFFDFCLDLTRAVVDAPNGGHRIVYQSRAEYNPSNTEEEIISSYNIRESRKIFTGKSLKHKKGTLLSFFIHPVQRAALILNQYRKFKSDPGYDPRIEKMSLTDIAYLLLNDKDGSFPTLRYKMSNFLIKSLTEKPEGVQNPSQSDVNAAVLLLKERCIIGLVEEMEESMHRFKHIIQIDKNKQDSEISNCFAPYIEDANNLHPIKEGTEEWVLLEKLNEADIQLYQKVKEAFAEQGQTMFVDLQYSTAI